MADPLRARSVYRYFDLADAFLRIRVVDAQGLRWPGRCALNRASYRRLVVQFCLPELGADCGAAIARLFPEDPLLVEDLLYQLCIEINPSLDIHEVRLRSGEECVEAEPQSERRKPNEKLEPEEFRARLCQRARDLEKRLSRQLVGQPAAIATVVRAVRRAAAGLASERRPLASLLFMGRTGTGKTELARALSKEIYGREGTREMVRIDCSEYALAHEYAKLIGSPPGYVGHEQGGHLTEAVANNPESLVLFDECEKAHPRLHNLLLQILEEGELTDGKGRRVGFERTIVVLTANCGADEIVRASRPVGFGQKRLLGRETLEAIAKDSLEKRFAPELLGRLDATLLFEELELPSIERIAAHQLTDLARRSRSRGLPVAFTPAVARWVAGRAHAPEQGAREVRHIIEKEIEPLLADRLLGSEERKPGLLRVRVEHGALQLDEER